MKKNFGQFKIELGHGCQKKKTCPTYTVRKYERVISITRKAGHWDLTNAQRHQGADFCFLQQIKIYPVCYEQP